MPKLTKVLELDVTPEKFINACSTQELCEVYLLLEKHMPTILKAMNGEEEGIPEERGLPLPKSG